MGPSERLKVAGDAAQLLENMGFVAVARLRDGVVTLELWRADRRLRHVVDDEANDPRVLAASCAAEFAAVSGGGGGGQAQ